MKPKRRESAPPTSGARQVEFTAQDLATLAASFVLDGATPGVAAAKAVRLVKVCAEALGRYVANAPPNSAFDLAELAARFLGPARALPGDALGNAVNIALDLWEISSASLCFHSDMGARDAACHAIPAPPQWPATLENFYRLVIKARDKADCQPRFKKYLRKQLDERYSVWRTVGESWPPETIDPLAEKEFVRIQKEGFDEDGWRWHAEVYLDWWEEEKRRSKQRAGKLGHQQMTNGKARPRKRPEKSAPQA